MSLFNSKLWVLVLLISGSAWAIENMLSEKNTAKVFTKDGNVYYVFNNRTTQITRAGKDKDPTLSPNNKIIAFIRRSDLLIPEKCDDFADTGSNYADQIWIYDITTKREKLLVKNNFSCERLEKMITDPSNLQFSPNNNVLYFIVSAWGTSGALHAVNIDGANLRYILPANSYEVVYKGEYKNNLIVQQHRHLIGGGSFDWYWLFSPQGKEIGPLGSEISNEQRKHLES